MRGAKNADPTGSGTYNSAEYSTAKNKLPLFLKIPEIRILVDIDYRSGSDPQTQSIHQIEIF